MNARLSVLKFNKVAPMLAMVIIPASTTATIPQRRAQILVLVSKIVLLAATPVIRPSVAAGTTSQTMTTRPVKQKSIASTLYVFWTVILATSCVFLHVHEKKMKIWRSVHVVLAAPMDVPVMNMTVKIRHLQRLRIEIFEKVSYFISLI